MKANNEGDECSESESSETDSCENQNDNTSYFSSYEDVEVHRLMLSDRSRTESYRKAILDNRPLFQGKIVMDVGAGTGILSLFAAEAGARKVYAIEASAMALVARSIIKQNKRESVVEVFSCQLEDFMLPESEKIDVIISEWMGFYLLHESMLSSVILARDKFLKNSGSIFPCVASIYSCPTSLHEFFQKEIHFWDSVYGYDFSVVKQLALQSKQKSPQIMVVDSSELLAEPELIKRFDLMTVNLEDIKSITARYFTSSTEKSICRGVIVWFDCEFPSSGGERNILSTAPGHLPTHWKQTVIVLPTGICLDAGDVIGFDIEFTQSTQNHRHYNIKVEVLGDDESHPVPCNCGCARCTLVKAFLQVQDQDGIDNAIEFIDMTS